VAHTGMHGANRLASNSLLEAVVFSERAAERALSELPERRASVGASPPAGWAGNPPGPIPEGVLVDYNWDVVRRSMWDYVGIVRTERRLLLGRGRVSATAAEVSDCFARYPVGRDLLELRNITLVGELIIRSALWRKESRGLHYMEDHPERDDERFRRDTVIEGSRE
jgi:L-aspartate oxidase